MSDFKNPYMMGMASAFKGDDTVSDAANAVFEIVEYTAETGMVEIGYDGPKGLRLYVTLPLPELIAKAAAFGRE